MNSSQAIRRTEEMLAPILDHLIVGATTDTYLREAVAEALRREPTKGT